MVPAQAANRAGPEWRRTLAMQAATLALYPIMEREGLQDLQAIAAAELARAAIEAFEEAMKNG